MRRADVDWLRVLATWLLFVFHAAKVFDPTPWFHIRNDQTSVVMQILCDFIGLWHMPLFFLVAGWSIPGALVKRGAGGFFRERVSRLLVPLVAGTICFGPMMKYLELRSGLEVTAAGLRYGVPYHETFREFLPTFFTHFDRFTWGHLWFLAYLFTLSLVWLPLYLWLARRPAPARVSRGWVYVPILPLAIVQVVLRPIWPGIQNLYDDWANVAYYSIYLTGGVLLAWSPALGAAVAAEWRRALAAAVGMTLVLLAGVLGVGLGQAVMLAGSAAAGWCWVLTLVGAAGEYARRPVPPWLVESALPIYVLHQPMLILVGWFLVLPLPLGIWPKFVLLVAGSIVTTVGVYQLLVRPFTVPRVLLGMKRSLVARRAPVPA